MNRSLLVVVPSHNEEGNLPGLAKTLEAQESLPDVHLVVVDDGSTDETLLVAKSLNWPCPVSVVHRENSGGLAGGSAFRAWDFGVEHGVSYWGEHDWYMKLDADVRLAPDYFVQMSSAMAGCGIAGGLLDDVRNREQSFHVQGAVKMYSPTARSLLRELPVALGFDVMDEVLMKKRGLTVSAVATARWRVARQTGASEGLLRGRKRNGVMCRWTGYDPVYFLLHVARYLFRRPIVVGAFYLAWGYLTAGQGPYSRDLRDLHARSQRGKIRQLFRNPVKFLRSAYTIESSATGKRLHEDG